MEQLAAETQRTEPEKSYTTMTAVFFFAGLLVVSVLYITIPIGSVFIEEFRLTAGQAAWVTSICSFCYAFGTIVFAPLSDRYGRKRIIMFGLVLLAMISLLTGLFSSYEAILIFRGIQGFVAASFAPTALTFMNELFSGRKRVTAIGFISAGFLMAGIIGQLYSSLVNDWLSWPYVFYLYGILCLAMAAVFMAAIPRDQPETGAQRSAIIKGFTTVLSKSFFRYSFMVTVVILMSFVGVYTVLESYLREFYGLNALEVLLIRSAGIVGMVLAPFGGLLAARFGTLPLMRSGLALGAVGISGIGLSGNLVVLALMSIVFTAGISVTVPSLIGLLGQFGGKEKAAAMSLYSFFLFVGSTAGPILAVFLMKHTGYVWTFEAIALCLVAGFFVTFPLAKKAAVLSR